MAPRVEKRIGHCIYCGDREALSGEHYLPACLGRFRNFERLYGKLCSECNRELGKLEEQLCRSGPEAFFRAVVGAKGRKRHKKVNPFYRGSAGANPIPIETLHPTLGCSIFCEIQEGGENAYPARQIIVRDLDGKHYSILITKKIKNARDLLKELKDRKLEHCTFVECWASAEEKELTEMLCKGVNVGISWSETTPYEMVTKTQFVATFTVNDGYSRTIAKIAFHYFLKHFPQFTGSETEFQAIKKFIMNGGDSDQYVKQGPGSFIYGLGHAVTTADRWGHLVAVDKSKRNIRAMLHFFVGPRIAPARYYEVYIERNPERIIYPQGIGHQFVYFDKPDGDGYGERVDPLLTASRKLML